MAHVSRWLAGEGLDLAGLTPEAANRFLAARRAAGYALYLSPKALVVGVRVDVQSRVRVVVQRLLGVSAGAAV